MSRASVAALVRAELEALRIPGCSLAVVERGGASWAEGFGYADLMSARRATADTSYHLFSGTKLFTAAAVLQLAEAGKLALDDAVTAHLPEYRSLRMVTLRHLLSHTSGLRDTLAAMLAVHFADEAAPDSAAALGRFRIAARRPPGRRVEYRNVNYALLGEVVSRVSGRPFTSFVRERLLEPLNMKAAFSIPAPASADAATGYMAAWEPSRFLLRLRFPKTARRLFRSRIGGLIELAPYELDTAAIGGLVGPVTGFLPFVLAQLNGGSGILSQASTALMQTLQARGRVGVEARLGVGLGWKIGEAAGRRFLNHEGGGAGFTSETRIYPREGLGMVIAMNRLVGTKSCSLAHRICEALCDARDSLFETG
ncbi:MAG: serine hydrolase domain-containing protein [Alphaproteobacteria bacterium]